MYGICCFYYLFTLFSLLDFYRIRITIEIRIVTLRSMHTDIGHGHEHGTFRFLKIHDKDTLGIH